MKTKSKSETIIIKNPSDKLKGFFEHFQQEKIKNRKELANKENFTFTINC